jgi:polyisoprenoid-binding protein YceI
MTRVSLALLFAFSVPAFAQAPAAPPAPAAPAPAPAASAPKTYKLDGGSTLIVRTWKDGAAASLAHDHAIRATEFSGEATYDPAAPEATKLQVTAQVASMIVDEDKDRAYVGIPTDKPVPEKDRRSVDDTLKGAECLEAKKFPTVAFKSTKLEKSADGKLTLHGDLTLHGVTKGVKMPITIEEKDGKVVGTGSFKLKTSDYGIKPYSAFLGAVKVKDEVQLHLKLVGTPK